MTYSHVFPWTIHMLAVLLLGVNDNGANGCTLEVLHFIHSENLPCIVHSWLHHHHQHIHTHTHQHRSTSHIHKQCIAARPRIDSCQYIMFLNEFRKIRQRISLSVYNVLALYVTYTFTWWHVICAGNLPKFQFSMSALLAVQPINMCICTRRIGEDTRCTFSVILSSA